MASRKVCAGAVARSCSAALLIGASTFAAAAQSPLTGDQIRSLMPGSQAEGTSPRDGKTWYADYAEDGTYTLRVPDSNWETRGTWQIEGDLWCTERPQRPRSCRQVIPLGGDEYLFQDERGEGTKATVRRN